MGNKVKYNLKNVYAAKLTETPGEDGAVTYSYATPQAIPGAVSISLSAEGESSPFYADGIVYFRTVTNNGYSGDLEIALIPEWFREEILQETLDENGVLIEQSNNAESVKFALLFKEDTIEPGTETLSLTADPRADGMVKARTGDTTDTATYNGWYSTVYEMVPVTEAGGGV